MDAGDPLLANSGTAECLRRLLHCVAEVTELPCSSVPPQSPAIGVGEPKRRRRKTV